MVRGVVAHVFKILGALLVTLWVYNIVMGSAGRTVMWRAIEPAVQQHWSDSTMRDGRVYGDYYGEVFESTKEYVNPR